MTTKEEARAKVAELVERWRAVSPDQVRNTYQEANTRKDFVLPLFRAMGWDTEGYHASEHPVQERMAVEIARWSGLDPLAIPTGVDGCGVTCFAVPLGAMATSFARFTAAALRGESPARVVAAMTTHPFMVGGAGRACTDVMEVARGRAFVKIGAEGVYCGGLPERRLGFALKVRDGGRRAAEVALLRVLASLGALSERDVESLAVHANPVLRNTRGDVVGEIRASVDLTGLA